MNQQLSIYEKEFLAVMMAIEKWRPYLIRGPFVIKTDHQSLCTLGDHVVPNPKLLWLLLQGAHQMAVALYELLFRDETKFSQTKSVADDY